MLNTIFGIVGWIGTLLVFAGVAIRLFRPEWDQYAYWAAVAGLVCVGLYTLTQWREIGRSFQKRETKLGAMMSISVIAVLAILIGINWVVSRRDKRWDLTAAASYTLSDQTVKVVQNLKAPVKVLVFDEPGSFQRFRDSLAMYTTASPNIQVEYVDTIREPARAREYDIVAQGTVVMEYDGRREKVMSEREQDLTNTLIKVTTGRQVKAYFVQGHGERDSAGNDRPRLRQRRRCVEARQLHGRQGGPRAVAGGCSRRCVGADYCRADGGLPEARSRRDQNLRAQRRQGAVPSRSARWRIRADRANARGVAEGMGHHTRTRRRHRHQRHGPDARHRRGYACRGELSGAPGH